MNAANPAITKPGSNPNEPTTEKNLFFSAKRLNGLEKVVITQSTMAILMEIGCAKYESKSSKNT